MQNLDRIINVLLRLAVADGARPAPAPCIPTGREMRRYLVAALLAALPCLILALAPLMAMNINVALGLPLMALVGMLDSTRTMAIRTLPIEIMPKEAVGTATGLIMTMGSTGGVIGPLVGGYLLDLTGDMKLMLYVLIGVSIASALIALRIPETGPRAKQAK